MPVCYLHGARKKKTIRCGEEHWNYHRGLETLEAKASRSRKLAELRRLEASCYQLGLISIATPRWRGRKPRE